MDNNCDNCGAFLTDTEELTCIFCAAAYAAGKAEGAREEREACAVIAQARLIEWRDSGHEAYARGRLDEAKRHSAGMGVAQLIEEAIRARGQSEDT